MFSSQMINASDNGYPKYLELIIAQCMHALKYYTATPKYMQKISVNQLSKGLTPTQGGAVGAGSLSGQRAKKRQADMRGCSAVCNQH